MAKKNLNVTLDYVYQCTETINEFGAVRKNSFLRFIKLTLGVDDDTANKIIDAMEERRDIYHAKYAQTTIIKTSDEHRAVYRYLDVFDAFMSLLEEAQQEEESAFVYPTKASFPRDFTFYDTRGYLYSVYTYDNNLAQKIGAYDRKKSKHVKGATLIVFTVGTSIKNVEIPTITGPYRYAVVRKSDDGNIACQISEMQGEKEQ